MIRRITHDTSCKPDACESACHCDAAPPPPPLLTPPAAVALARLVVPYSLPAMGIVNKNKTTDLTAMHATLILDRERMRGIRPS